MSKEVDGNYVEGNYVVSAIYINSEMRRHYCRFYMKVHIECTYINKQEYIHSKLVFQLDKSEPS